MSFGFGVERRRELLAMQYPLSFYAKRNAEIRRLWSAGSNLEYLCDRFGLKDHRMRQILGLPRTDPRPPGPRSPDQLLRELDLTAYRVRGALLRSTGSWPYPSC